MAFDQNTCSLGDLNGDNIVNVLDIVQALCFIVDTEECEGDSSCADMNGDMVLNVLDIVMMVNLIIQ